MRVLSLLALFLMIPCCSQSAQYPGLSNDNPPPAIGVNPPPPPDAPSGDAGAKVAALTAGFNLHYGSEYCDQGDPILREIASDMEKKLGAFEGRRTPLKLFRYYSDVSEKTLGFGNVDKKLDKLFLCGRIPRQLKGFHHGVTLSLRTDLSDRLHVDFLRGFYGRLVAPGNPWAGKSFEEIGPEQLKSFTGSGDLGGVANYLGVNSFRHDTQTKGGRAHLNAMARAVLKHVIDTKAVPGADEYKDSWIESTGGYFLAKEDRTLDMDHPNKGVLALNYRWRNLGNKFPNDRLIDEIVEVADGLYLGKLFYATNVDNKPFDPRKPIEEYRYRSFGYFLLMDDSWVHDKNALWPELMTGVAQDDEAKYQTIHFDKRPGCDALRRTITTTRNTGRPDYSILHYIQDRSLAEKGVATDRGTFNHLHEVFMCGVYPDDLDGFYHGGVTRFRDSGFFSKFPGILDAAWRVSKPFSPWSGKSFKHVNLDELRQYIGADAEWYRGKGNVTVGSNTYSDQSLTSFPAAEFIKSLKFTHGMVVEEPTFSERIHGVATKSFFFVAMPNTSVNPQNNKKWVFQFHYRWKDLHTMPPDNLCTDEIVRIADGLYLGQLLYATNLNIPFDPDRNYRHPEDYRYRLFGYFLLMDDDWKSLMDHIWSDNL
jgi:hypothetical protein